MPSILRAGWAGVNPVPEVALAPQLAARVLLGVQAGPQETAGALPFTVQGVHVQEVIAHERARGVEPPSDAWKAPALPLSYTHESSQGVVTTCHVWHHWPSLPRARTVYKASHLGLLCP